MSQSDVAEAAYQEMRDRHCVAQAVAGEDLEQSWRAISAAAEEALQNEEAPKAKTTPRAENWVPQKRGRRGDALPGRRAEGTSDRVAALHKAYHRAREISRAPEEVKQTLRIKVERAAQGHPALNHVRAWNAEACGPEILEEARREEAKSKQRTVDRWRARLDGSDAARRKWVQAACSREEESKNENREKPDQRTALDPPMRGLQRRRRSGRNCGSRRRSTRG